MTSGRRRTLVPWIAAAWLAAVPGSGRAAEPGPSVAGAPVDVSGELARDLAADLGLERARAGRAVGGWSAVGATSGVYIGLALAGRVGRSTAGQYLAFVGAAAAVTGVVRALVRRHEVAAIARRLDADVAASGPAAIRLSTKTAEVLEADLHARLDALRTASRGALRAGCVLPVLLGGIGLYGLAVGRGGGDELAGVGLGGAMVIGAPSVLTYWGLRERLARTEGLAARWNRALLGQEVSP